MSLKTRVIQAVVCSVASVLAIAFNLDDALGVSENGLKHIANEEGCRLSAYQCSANVWTIGLGHTQGINQDTVFTLDDAAESFVESVASAENVVKRRIKQTPSQGEYDMMVSFVYNLGAGNFASSTLLKKFNQNDRTGACEQYPRWVFVNGKDCRIDDSNCAGIPKRRAIEREVCLNDWEGV